MREREREGEREREVGKGRGGERERERERVSQHPAVSSNKPSVIFVPFVFQHKSKKSER